MTVTQTEAYRVLQRKTNKNNKLMFSLFEEQ